MNKNNLKNNEINKQYNLRYYISLIVILFIIIVCIISLIIGVMTKLNKILLENKVNRFFKKNVAIAWTSIIFTVFTIFNSVLTNYLFLDCPEYSENPEHKWFKYSLPFQIIDILFCLTIIVIGKYWVSIIVSHSIDKLNDTPYLKFLNVIYNDEELIKESGKISHLNIREKSGNVTTAFITLLFQRKLRNKINYLIKKLKLV